MFILNSKLDVYCILQGIIVIITAREEETLKE